MDRIRDALRQLGGLQSVASFSLLYYNFLAERLADEDAGDRTLRRSFAELVEWEVRYHTALGNLTDADGVSIIGIGDLADKRHAGLCEVVARLSRMSGLSGRREATRQLIVAECFYQTVMYERVVSCLEAAIEAGARDPLVFFSLGYNRYVVAEQVFAATDASTGDHVVVDARGYRRALLEAVTAFEDGLSGGELDAQLYWWIGTCLERAGFANAARKAFREAEQGAEEQALEPTEQTDGSQEPFGEEDAELEMVRRALRRPCRASDIIGDGRPC